MAHRRRVARPRARTTSQPRTPGRRAAPSRMARGARATPARAPRRAPNRGRLGGTTGRTSPVRRGAAAEGARARSAIAEDRLLLRRGSAGASGGGMRQAEARARERARMGAGARSPRRRSGVTTTRGRTSPVRRGRLRGGVATTRRRIR
jgi:hypothetical protein